MKFYVCTSCLSVFVLLVSGESHAFDALDELKACARMEEAVVRTECYEALGQRVLAADAKTVSTVSPPAPTDAPVSLPDALGGSEFAEKAGEPALSNRGLVTSCEKAADRKWFYIFESGQVWKQVDSRRRRHKDCYFYVTITKDGFGYKMTIDGTKDKIRINRRR